MKKNEKRRTAVSEREESERGNSRRKGALCPDPVLGHNEKRS